jgi:A-macroglobulin TED domain/Alpha-2-macroglobulin family/MG2 domain/Carboxypeptidase regulatory-like domain/A-macroglobulin receptor binding domain/Macroglobulin domain MG3/Alpha-2-macroglobulin bait region domain
MNRRWFLFLCCLLIPLFLAGQIARARGSVTIDEARSRFLFGPHDAQVLLALVNASTPTSAKIHLDLLAPDDRLLATADLTTKVSNGEQQLPIRLPFDVTSPDETHLDLLWLRLRCRIEVSDSAPVETVMTIGQIAPELFEIQVLGSPMLHERMRYQTRVRAFHPFTNAPAKGVQVAGQFKFTDMATSEERQLKASGVTDKDGHAVLTYDVPPNLKADDPEFKVTGRRGPLRVEASTDPQYLNQTELFVSTDKPLYQPGQTLHLRTLAFGMSKHALANQDLTLKINDPDDALLFRTDLKTSRFGVAAADWTIPENSRLGDYELEFVVDGDTISTRSFKVSRYDLPNFSVVIKPDKSYYLPGQSARVEVKADYLFGQPVKKGHVRVVRETEREWSYENQKYEIKEGATYEGDIDSGSFTASIDLAAEQDDFSASDYWKFRDLKYAAYFTDASTNRTEQRRFQLRISKEAIHIYPIHLANRYRESSRAPLSFYISTFYADGRPARCDVQLRQKREDSKPASEPLLMTARTNSFGLAKIDRLMLPEQARKDSDFDLAINARDQQGLSGNSSEDFDLYDVPFLAVNTNKTLFAAGEPIEVTITSSEKELTTVFEVTHAWDVVDSRIIKLHGGRASLVLPYRKEYKDALVLLAYAGRAEDEPIFASRPVLFPGKQNLSLDVRADQRSYRPGDSAHFDFRIRDRYDHPSESSLGVVIVDKAVSERVRSQEEFGVGSADFYNDLKIRLGRESIAGITRSDLNNIDMSRPVSPDLALAAEVFLNSSEYYFEDSYGSDYYQRDFKTLFSEPIQAKLAQVKLAIEAHRSKTGIYPRNIDSMRSILKTAQIDFDQLLDPWGTPFRVDFSTREKWDYMNFTIAGVDKRFGTDDDFSLEPVYWLYFTELGAAINRAVSNYRERTGDFIRSKDMLRKELAAQGINLDDLRDRWSHPYEFTFSVAQSNLVLTVTSFGPDGKKNEDGRFNGDDFEVWSSTIDYFTGMREKINLALKQWATQHSSFPASDNETNLALRAQGIEIASLRDEWKTPYRLALTIKQTYDNKVRIENTSSPGSQPHVDITPVTNQIGVVDVRSAGADGQVNTSDDFTIASFTGVISSQSAKQSTSSRASAIEIFPAGKGGIKGLLRDVNGAVIFGAQVQATATDNTNFATSTDESGSFALRDLPAGIYELHVQAQGFKALKIDQVVVVAGNMTELDLTIELGTLSDTVTVGAGASVVDVSSSAITELPLNGANYSLLARKQGSSRRSPQLTETPRLRNYFPETLVWQPLLETDKHGWAKLDFKLADNITTWQMSVIGSTADGQLGIAEKEITAFQPFFVEHDPPRILTEGDEISLPVVVRNYLSKPQTVKLNIKPESWFTLLSSASRDSRIAADDAARETFDFRTIASIKDGKQRVTAQAAAANDAIEKPITVHPDGEEKSAGAADIVGQASTLTLEIPANVVPSSTHGELKLYPNLVAHLVESVEAIMERPYGCGEQTISSTYPSLLVVRHFKQQHPNSPLLIKAERYLRDGYARLKSYQHEAGGFTYWGRGDADIALTAYALRFLNEAGQAIPIDEGMGEAARTWLARQQRPDGRWTASRDNGENADQDALLTAYVLRVLVTVTASAEQKPAFNLERALSFLEERIARVDEPYLIASVALTASRLKNERLADACRARLISLAHPEGQFTYWNLESNTPFYGWGSAGRIETTALALQALGTACDNTSGHCPRALMNRGLLFLLKEKDKYGVWLSSQTTINVLDALLTFIPAQTVAAPGSAQTAEIIVNGLNAKSVSLPSGNEVAAPISIDISTFLRAGSNSIEVRRPNGSAPASVQAVAGYYVPWQASTDKTLSGDSSALRLVTRFNRIEGKVNDEITCHVEAERVGHRGYGMMLAEIGLPPGADVDRASLDLAMTGSGWAINQYDVLPDRVMFYLWPRAGGITFDFKFRPRFGLKAKSAASSIYDYYNPEARAVVAPAKFLVK